MDVGSIINLAVLVTANDDILYTLQSNHCSTQQTQHHHRNLYQRPFWSFLMTIMNLAIGGIPQQTCGCSRRIIAPGSTDPVMVISGATTKISSSLIVGVIVSVAVAASMIL